MRGVSPRVEPIVVVHGGASEWYSGTGPGRDACRRAAEAGANALAAGGTALDAVIAAVRVVEDDPACNAGTGAVLTSRGTLELDACVMDGASLDSGAVAVLPPFLHPVDIARAVLEDGRYHLLAGDGAAAFARAQSGTPRESPASPRRQSRYFWSRCSEPSLQAGRAIDVFGTIPMAAQELPSLLQE